MALLRRLLRRLYTTGFHAWICLGFLLYNRGGAALEFTTEEALGAGARYWIEATNKMHDNMVEFQYISAI